MNKIIFGIIVSAVALFLIVIATSKRENKQTDITSIFPKANAITITANPFDLSQVAYISKFRSCWGHELPGQNFQGEEESGGSMRHYVGFLQQFNNTNDQVKLFAPFDGFFFDIVPPAVTAKGNEDASFVLVSPIDPNVGFKIAGANMLPGFEKGNKVKAGQLLGYASIHNNDIDADYQAIDNNPGNERAMVWIFDSMFNHMSPEVLAEYEKYGLTKENAIISKKYREQNPCDFAGGIATNMTDEEDLFNKAYTPWGMEAFQKELFEKQKKKF